MMVTLRELKPLSATSDCYHCLCPQWQSPSIWQTLSTCGTNSQEVPRQTVAELSLEPQLLDSLP